MDSVLEPQMDTFLTMPKFKIASEYMLKKELIELGLETAFDPSNAKLQGFNENLDTKSLFIDEIIQKAFIEVNEEGTEAAAATGVLAKSALINLDQKVIKLNRPFLFFIKDVSSGLILFSGRVSNPAL